jgi:hypothetical protein
MILDDLPEFSTSSGASKSPKAHRYREEAEQ